jgi:hypothetical protein
MNSELTALTRPRISSGVSICTSDDRITTLITSAAPSTTSAAIESQNDLGHGEDKGGNTKHRHGAEHGPAHPATAAACGPATATWPARPLAGAERSSPKPPRAGDQDVAGIDRQQRGGAAQQHRKQVKGDGAQYHRVLLDKGDTGKQRPDAAADSGLVGVGCGYGCRRAGYRLPARNSTANGAVDRGDPGGIQHAPHWPGPQWWRSGWPRQTRARARGRHALGVPGAEPARAWWGIQRPAPLPITTHDGPAAPLSLFNQAVVPADCQRGRSQPLNQLAGAGHAAAVIAVSHHAPPPGSAGPWAETGPAPPGPGTRRCR